MTPGDEKLPALRPVEIVPVRRDDGQVLFALHDPTQLASRGVAISAAGCFVLAHLDGRHSCGEIQTAFQAQLGRELPEREIRKLVAALDVALLLEGHRAETALAERRAAYAAAPSRDSRERYPDAAALRETIERLLARGAAAPVRQVHGLIAPHLDYNRGAPCYADAYATLAAAGRAERYVVLGTNHFGASRAVAAATKDFHTALGRVATDRAFIQRMEERLGVSLCTHEIDHLAEHSIELQVHFLQVIMDGSPFELVPLLCPDVCGPTGTAPADGRGPDLGAFADVLAGLLDENDRPTIVIAGADLSHVGQRFGDPEATTPDRLEEVGRSDRSLLDLLEQRREGEFIRRISRGQNHTRICSSGAIYAVLRSLPRRPCRILSYHQAVNSTAETHVTCAAAVIS